MKWLLIVILFFVLFFLPNSSVEAQRAECDACGYCVGRTPPGNWEQCRDCVYKGASQNAGSNETLQLKKLASGKLEPVYKVEGKHFTQLGCLDVGDGSFSDPTAPGGVLNFLLNRLIFPVVGVLSFISLLYGAFLLMTAQDRPEQVGKGKSYIVGAIVGLLFTLSAILIINILAGDILRIPGFSRSPQAAVSVRADIATVGGKTVYPILGVSYNGKEIESKTLSAGNQDVSINVPINPSDLSTEAVLRTIIFTMKNDACYSVSSNRTPPTCCDPGVAAARPQCANPDNYNGDVNMHISSITINGKKCTKYERNGTPVNPVIGISSTGASVYCTGIEN